MALVSRSFNKSASFSRSGPVTAQRIPERVLCSLYEDKSTVDVKVGLCFFNIATGEITLSTILDSQTYVRTIHKLHVFEPLEILVPNQYLNPNPNKLSVILKSNVSSEIKFIGVDKKHFNQVYGMESIEQLAFERDVTYLKEELRDKYHALCALAAGIKYIKTSNKVNQIKLKQYRIKYEVPESTMFIDTRTIRSLQLTENLLDKSGLSFMKFLNSTLTKMGERVLRNNILQPLTDKDSIIMRLEAVKELTTKDSLMDDLRMSLRGLQDLDRLFTLLLLSKESLTPQDSAQKINTVILIKQAVVTALEIGNHLEDANCSLLKQIRDICKDEGLLEVKGCIDDYINEDCNWASGALDINNQRIYAVKAGKNGLLDVSRQVYKFVVDEVLSITEKLSEEYGMGIEQSYNSRRGFHLKIRNYQDLEVIPEIFINCQKKKKHLECTTLDIIKCNARLDDTVSEIVMISDQVIQNLLGEITAHIPCLFMISEALAILDLIQCFTNNASKNKYTCPEISDMLTLKASRHPVIETLIKNFVPNDICAVKDTSRVQIITGTNMSGKSVYLRQVALLSIMTQIGSFVPAEYAIFPLFNSLKARICVDNFASTTSNFAMEMKEMCCILEDVDDNSLVIIDELGRGSSLNDGFAISLALCEHLVTTKATVFISTHFHELSKVMGSKPGVVQNHMSSSCQEDQLKMNYRITSGMTDVKRYGIKLAKKFLDNDTLEKAYEISKKLEDSLIQPNPVAEERAAKDRKILNLVKLLKYIVGSGELDRELLVQIQEEFLRN